MSLNNKISKQVVPKDTFKLEDITSDYVDLRDSPIKYKLCKLIFNNNCGFDDFINVKQKNVSNKIKIIDDVDVVLTLLIQGVSIPPNRVRPIGSNEFEIRIKRTRLYYFFDHPNTNIIVLGQFHKTTENQQSYIQEFRKIKTKYLESKII